MAEIATRLGQPLISTKDLDDAMAAMDEDGNDEVDFEEFRLWWEGFSGRKVTDNELKEPWELVLYMIAGCCLPACLPACLTHRPI